MPPRVRRFAAGSTAPQLLRLTEVGARLGVSHDTVHRLVNSGSLPVIDVAASGQRPRLRVSEMALAAFITERTIRDTKSEAR